MTLSKISFCTVCMNRLHHLKKTLTQNIKDNLDYSNIEFVVLDYNSSDGLSEWVENEMKEYLDSGILKFYRVSDQPYFDRSHSRNMAVKLAKGDIVCNVDADNYTGRGFATYVQEVFSRESTIYLVADTQKRFYFLRNAFGRFCVSRALYLELGGLDEEMKSYGSETVDFYERLKMAGAKERIIENTAFLQAISHGDDERIANEYFLQSLACLYIHYISPEESELLILYKDGTFDKGTLIPEEEDIHLPGIFKQESFVKGVWKRNDQEIDLSDGNMFTEKMTVTGETLKVGNNTYYLISDRSFLLNVAKNYSFITNVYKQRKNKTDRNMIVNGGSFGVGKACQISGECSIID